MEVDANRETGLDKPLMRDYWRKYRARTYIIITCAQSTVILLFLLFLQLAGFLNLDPHWFFLIALICASILNAVTITLVHVIGTPFRDLVQAIVLAAGEPTADAPPNPNVHGYDSDGFKEILQTVYELAAKDAKEEKEAPSDENSLLAEAMMTTTTSFVVLDKDKKVVFANGHAPTRKNTHDEDVLDLIFPDDDTLDAWIDEKVSNKLTAERHWSRVSNKLPGEKERKLYDVVASYKKDSRAETVPTILEKTSDYMPEEDDLDFISFAAHELRGPITVIRGYLDVLNEELGPVLERDQTELMERLIVTSNRLTGYVNNILNASRYDRRHMKLHLSEESVRHIYDLISDDMQLRANSQNRLLVADLPESLPEVAADANAIGEVLGNLIDNAIKYSNEGGLVHVMAREVPGFVEISVIDRGIGMPSNVLPNLFHKFYRSHRSRETVAGTGIGLYISKGIVGSHGGTITARSVENEGSTFSFTLPIYGTVAEKLKESDNSNKDLIEHGSGWIRNHSLYRG